MKQFRSEEEFSRMVDTKRRNRMSKIDALPPDIRELVHEYGYHIVDNFMRQGIVRARIIKHLVETVLNEFSPTRGSYSQQGLRTEIVQHLKNTEE